MRLRFLISVALLLVLSSAAIAANPPRLEDNAGQSNVAPSPPSIDGSWQGVVSSAAGKVRLLLKVSKAADGALRATLVSLDQGAGEVPVEIITFKDSYLRFEMKSIQASFDGGLSRDGSEISGQFRQGLPVPLVLRREDAGFAVPPPTAGFMRGRVKLDPCNMPLITKDAGCGKYEVFEDRVAKSGRKIALNVLVLPAISAKPSADPIFVLAGGPGQAAVSVVKSAGDYLVKLHQERDLVFVDQRGTGESNPLICIDDLFVEFLSKGSTKGLNDSCVKEIERPPFITKLPPQLAK